MENEKLIPLTDEEMLALLAASETVFTSVPDGTVSTTSEVRFPVPAAPCF